MAGPAVLENYVGGRWRPSLAAPTLDVPNPGTGELLAKVPLSTRADVDEAISAARTAFIGWRAVPVADRARVIARFAAILEREAESLAEHVVQENGKSFEEARGSVRRGIEATEFATSAPTLLQGRVLENVTPGVDTELVREPVGVVVGITPFNFPVMIPLWMAPLAIVCGNTFILKPSERVPISAVSLTRLFEEAGVPPGVFNLIHGSAEAVDALLRHPGVDAVSFVGSASTARHVYSTAADAGKRVQALSGAKNHVVVLPDADLDRSVPAILSSAFGSSGERCLAGSVVVAVEPIGDELVRRLAEGVRGLRPGPAEEGGNSLGPLIRPEHAARVQDWVARGRAEGAEVVATGTPSGRVDGYFVAPVLFDHVRPEMAVAQEEIFGPILCVIRAASLPEALAIANRSRFGNAAAIFTRSGRAAREFRTGIEVGMVGVNIGVPAPAAYFPFVGWKGSFYGDLHATGSDAVEFYTRKKVVTTRWF